MALRLFADRARLARPWALRTDLSATYWNVPSHSSCRLRLRSNIHNSRDVLLRSRHKTVNDLWFLSLCVVFYFETKSLQDFACPILEANPAAQWHFGANVDVGYARQAARCSGPGCVIMECNPALKIIGLDPLSRWSPRRFNPAFQIPWWPVPSSVARDPPA